MDARQNLAIEYAECAPRDVAGPVFDLFVVHAVADTEFVRGYLLPVLNLPPSRVLLIDELTPGASITTEIARAVSRSRFTIVVLSPAYLEDRWAAFGEQLASHMTIEDRRGEAGHIIPLRLVECALPLQLKARVSLDFTERTGWELQAARLRKLLHTQAPAPARIACPYPGMRPFTASQASWFFGRDKEIDELIGRLDRGEREIYMIGPSGSGKTSLVQAGLLHALDTGSSRLARSFVVRAMRPGERPCERLTKLLEGNLTSSTATIGALIARHPPAERVLVFIDQLEELFTIVGAAERQQFLAMLRTLRADTRCHLVLALRADSYGALADSGLWSEMSSSSRFDVAPLRGPALAQAITLPALQVSVHVEARLCDRLIADAADEPGALPLVQEMLRLLWEQRRQRFLGLSEYEAFGDGRCGLGRAIMMRADTTMRAFTAAQQTIARRVLLRLVSFGAGRANTCRQQKVKALRSVADDEAEFSHVLQRLIEDRVVTVDGVEGGDDALANVSHEALITACPVFRAWIASQGADEQRRRWLEARVCEWIERGRGSRGLFDRAELCAAVQWVQSAAAQELGYGAEFLEFVVASQRAIDKEERQRRQRLFLAIVVLAGFSALSSTLGGIAWVQRRHARREGKDARDARVLAETQEGAARRLLGMNYLDQGRTRLMEGHPMQALPYFVEARAAGIDGPVLRMLFAQAARILPRVTVVNQGVAATKAAFSPDGTRVVTGGEDGRVQVRNLATGSLLTLPLEHQGAITVTVFSPDSARLVIASEDKTARVWNAVTGKPVASLLGHQGAVTAAVFSQDGARVVTVGEDKTARVWDAAIGKPLAPPLEHQGVISKVAFSSDGTHVVTVTDKTAWIWDVSSGKPVALPLKHQSIISLVVFSSDGTRVVTVNHKTARVWDVSSGKPVTSPLRHQGAVASVAFSPGGGLVVTASEDRTARVWDASTGRLVARPFEHLDSVHVAVFSPDGTRVVTASEDKTARVWDVVTGEPVTPPLEHHGGVHAAAFSPDGRRVVTSAFDKTVQVWDASTGIPVTLPLEHDSLVKAAAFTPDGGRVITMSADETTRIWDVSGGRSMGEPLEHQDAIFTARFSLDGTRVVTASADGTARVWDASTGKPVSGPFGHRGPVAAATFDESGTRVVTVSGDQAMQVWDVPAERAAMPLPADRGRVQGASVQGASSREQGNQVREQRGRRATVAFNARGTRVVIANHDLKTQVRVLEVATGKRVGLLLKHRNIVSAVALSPDGTYVATGSLDNTARVWNASTGEPMTQPLDHQDVVESVAFSPDGMHVITASRDSTARVWDARTGKPVTAPLKHQGPVLAAVFSPDGKRVVTASDDNTARVWDVATGKPVAPPLEHRGPVDAAMFSPDGTRVVTASHDKTARVWDASTGHPVTLPLEHAGLVHAAEFSPDGTRIVTVSDDQTARVWTIPTDKSSLEDWKLLARCSPFAFVESVLSSNTSPRTMCP